MRLKSKHKTHSYFVYVFIYLYWFYIPMETRALECQVPPSSTTKISP